ncbi:MAG: HPr(Ser) kinase/phosphatase [Gammaproteobacteria bacterium]|nr:HPr(Ser) kinase/phosphatase [Gammaproteobacteria bacterium]NIR82890.1 HPr(Ser) kinase/phosphatase [Gammaproteobacteria bacterium]NIR90002.1 HPr(Ser) kinase/phosphatase [Gammaproteobacteria bacterium]NIU03482.1 HPr(Ser) kinase/phosphatase [Gammaproteobacteria bacterium]NIV51001.1 HPr(Ser) kinase/phosphatase [Gammaproteobacteria bacterium]
MSAPVTPLTLYESLKSKLELEWVVGDDAQSALIGETEGPHAEATLVGHLNLIHPSRIQVLGAQELEFLDGLGKNSHYDALNQLFAEPCLVVIIAENAPIPEEFTARARASHQVLLSSKRSSHEVISYFRYHLTSALAEKVTLHGVFMEVMGIGVLITGGAGVGKSELALELVTRGHRLVADDAPEFSQIAPDILNGSCPDLLRGFLEVRGLGILDLRAMFGDGAVKHHKYLRLIINLIPMSEEALQQLERFPSHRDRRDILGVQIPEITLPVAPGRNLSVLVEAAVRDHILRMDGYDATREFFSRHQDFLGHSEL